MRSIYNIYEGILGNVDDILAAGEDAIAQEANIDTLPTVKDFEKGVFNRKWHQANWYCPNVIKKYRSKYPNFIPDTVDSISVILDAEYGRVVDCNLYFSTRGYVKLKSISGWSDGFVGANLRKYKQMAIDILTKLAKNPDKMDKMMDYANKYYMYWDKVKNGTDNGPAFDIKFNIRSFNEL
jgi:hypothetical protein